jgi:phage gp46-like protein
MDLKLFITEQGTDIEIQNGSPILTGGLESAVFLSLFTPAFWGNSIADIDGQYTSRLPELYQAPLTNTSRLDAIEAVKNSLQWLINKGIASEIQARGEIPKEGYLFLSVKVTQPSGDSTIAYNLNWIAQEVESI